MKVKMLTSIAGHNWSASHGHIVDMPDDEAKRHIRSGNAEKVDQASTAHITVGAPPKHDPHIARDPVTPTNPNKAR